MTKSKYFLVARIIIGLILFMLVINVFQLIITAYQMAIVASDKYLISNMGDSTYMNVIVDFCAILCFPLIAVVFAEVYKTYLAQNALAKTIINYATIALEVITVIVVITLFFKAFEEIPTVVEATALRIQAVDYGLCVTFQTSLLYIFVAVCALIGYGIFFFKKVELLKPVRFAVQDVKEVA